MISKSALIVLYLDHGEGVVPNPINPKGSDMSKTYTDAERDAIIARQSARDEKKEAKQSARVNALHEAHATESNGDITPEAAENLDIVLNGLPGENAVAKLKRLKNLLGVIKGRRRN